MMQKKAMESVAGRQPAVRVACSQLGESGVSCLVILGDCIREEGAEGEAKEGGGWWVVVMGDFGCQRGSLGRRRAAEPGLPVAGMHNVTPSAAGTLLVTQSRSGCR